MYYAHSKNAAGDPQTMEEHLRNVAADASTFAEPLGAGKLAYAVGLLHDVGKYNPAFQAYLLACETNTAPPRGPDHKAAGAQLAVQRGFDVLALLIQGHHGGLHRPSDLRQWLLKRQDDPVLSDAIALAEQDMPDIREIAPPMLPPHVKSELDIELFLRLLFSTLVDADNLDTERHFTDWKATTRVRDLTLATLLERFDRQPPAPATACTETVRAARDKMYDACVQAAEKPPGFFRLTMPTGGGKTRSGMAFALRHAVKYGKQRVIVAVPFISITQQTAKVYREIFGDEDDRHPAVLEHHSATVGGDSDEPGYRPADIWHRLAAENWDAPIVVTTTVQLFESLFANKTGQCRKLHRLANSVIILDEAQALPPFLLKPILDALGQLVRHYGTTVVISTATQPAFEAIAEFREIGAREIVPDAARYFADLTRVAYEWRTDRTYPFAEVADWLRDASRGLAVMNTKQDALDLLAALDDPDALHLSTLLCGRHRMDVIAEVTRRLQKGESCRLVATQVIEAGVDIDFPLVLRALGPLDSIIQVAGRCNRGGVLERGRVIVFRPEGEHGPPGTYQTATGVTQALINRADLDPNDPAVSTQYFAAFYGAVNVDANATASKIQWLRTSLDYPAVRKAFRMIEDDTETVIITDYGTDAQRKTVAALTDRLRVGGPDARYVLRKLQPFTVAVRRRAAREYRDSGLIEALTDDIGIWHGDYHDRYGVTGKPRDADWLVVSR
ncbi:MAG: CRISPR-associated helicase Cas3' [Thermomicrobiales bacterium]